MSARGPVPRRHGTTPAEVLVVIAVVLAAVLLVLTVLPRQRESARQATCRSNLSRIGIALTLYDTAHGRLPAAAALGPLEALRQGLGLDEFDALRDPKTLPRPVGSPPAPQRVRGFLCPSDRGAVDSTWLAPTSYRACAGGDVAGRTGAFALGEVRSLAEIEAADGLAYTAAFCERLVGTGDAAADPLRRYSVVPGPIDAAACPPAGPDAGRNDAGSDFARPGWESSAYHHAMPPGAAPSCLASDGPTARMGASSAHRNGMHLLRLDLSVALVGRRIDPDVWRRLGTVRDQPPP